MYQSTATMITTTTATATATATKENISESYAGFIEVGDNQNGRTGEDSAYDYFDSGGSPNSAVEFSPNATAATGLMSCTDSKNDTTHHRRLSASHYDEITLDDDDDDEE
mmetsp:Transcript_24057/g.26828  ORF Transcript_24057/g.26828 Transcript_24057/m.26828 type:complete len:109 (+) Transcript_24057:55-381(+)